MRLTVHNVGHGSCISLVHENGNVMLWDCGHSEDNRPSLFLPAQGIRTIHKLFITNYDEDHISDLPNLRVTLNIPELTRNRSITTQELHALKLQSGPISAAMQSMLDMHSNYIHPVPAPPPDFPRVEISHYYNPYGATYPDTNNISLVTFVTCGGTKFIIPGDVENKGWLGLLAQPGFITDLSDVSVFIASHHGRESGYCSDVFDYCSPDVVVFSDSNIQHATQEMSSTYANHARGMQFDGTTRYVVSTRNDGNLYWDR
jgi:beta-lactamase superfamily II metal-dependent hydrolase